MSDPAGLLAQALGWRGGDARERATALLDALGGVRGLLTATEAELRAAGIRAAARSRLRATVELLLSYDKTECPSIRSPRDAVEQLGAELRLPPEERLVLLCLNRRHKLINQHTVTVGSPGLTIVDPAQIYTHALRQRAASIVIAHNHPSGDPTPSSEDIQVTRRVAAAGDVLGVPLLDHLIIAADGYVSLRERGEVPGAILAQVTWAA